MHSLLGQFQLSVGSRKPFPLLANTGQGAHERKLQNFFRFFSFLPIFAAEYNDCIMLSKDRIIAESTDLFVRYVVKSVRMDDIASRLGVSKRTIYELFGDRESLIRTCVEYFYNRQERRYEARMASARNVIEEFMLLLEDWENSVTVNMNFMSDLERFYPEIYGRISSERHRQGAERLKQKLRQGVADGLFFPDINVEFSAAILIASVSTIFTSPSTYHSAEISMSEAFRYIMMCFFRGISTAEGLHVIDEMFGKYFPRQNGAR